jgi:hypothetical protein
MFDHLAEFRMQETSSLDTFKLPTDEQRERVKILLEKAEVGGAEAIDVAYIVALILLNKDRILGYDRL